MTTHLNKDIEREKQRQGDFCANKLQHQALNSENSRPKKKASRRDRELESVAQKEARNAAREIKSAFEQASREGLRTLANISLFRAAFELAEANPLCV